MPAAIATMAMTIPGSSRLRIKEFSSGMGGNYSTEHDAIHHE
jgi:hypothetical protein